MKKTMISKLCYELYKIDWKRNNITTDIEIDNIKDYYEGLVDNDTDYTYEDYVSEFGYGGYLYACYDEFCESEYLDKDYICGLLNYDKLIQMYLEDIREADN